MMHLSLLEKQERANPKIIDMKEIIIMRAEMNELEIRTMIQQISETKINNIDKPLAKLTPQRERRRPKLIKSSRKGGYDNRYQ
jgi:hypothetical protein